MREPAILDQPQRILRHRSGLGRKARDQIGAEDDVGPELAHARAKFDGVAPRMPPLHPLQDHVVARLQRQMQMRHQALLLGKRDHQFFVGLDAVQRGQPQALQFWQRLQQRTRQKTELRIFREIAAP